MGLAPPSSRYRLPARSLAGGDAAANRLRALEEEVPGVDMPGAFQYADGVLTERDQHIRAVDLHGKIGELRGPGGSQVEQLPIVPVGNGVVAPAGGEYERVLSGAAGE